VPCWVDLAVPDTEASAAFYGSVLGWTVTPTGGGDFGDYRIALVDGQAVAGLAPVQPGQHTAWTVYLASDDVDATAAAISAHGGQLLAGPMDVGPAGRMAIAQDPTGAVFGVWQAGEMIGAGRVNEPGALSWEDLRSTDPARAHDFYRAVFGYLLTPVEMAGPDYGTFSLPGRDAPLGGMGGMMGSPEGVPSHWLALYYEVTHPILDWYGERGILVSVDAMRPAEEVGRQILTALTVLQQLLDGDPDAPRTPIDLTGLGGAFGAP
jgi:predicted enzyme related to lactoylglutathione lyase